MNESNRPPSSSDADAPSLFSWRQAPKILFALACASTIAALLLTLVNRRKLNAQSTPANDMPAQAERALAAKLIPPPVPDEENFGMTPFFASVFERSGQTESPRWPDDFKRADQWRRQIPTLADSTEGRKTGRFVTDLVAWKKAFAFSRSGESGEVIEVSDTIDPAANAQAAVAVLEALKPYEPVLSELHAANSRRYCRFNANYSVENPWAILLPQLAVVKRTCQLLRLHASAELAAGHSEQALGDVMLMLRLVDSPKDEPTLISQLVRVACLEITMQPIWEGLAGRYWSDAQLQTLQARLQQFDFIADLQRALEAERAWGNVTIGLVRDKRTPGFLLSLMESDGKLEPWQIEADRVLLKCPRDWFDQEQRNYNRLLNERLLAGFDVGTKRVHPRVAKENARLLEQALEGTDTLVQEHLVFARMLLIAPSRVHLKLASAQGTADLAVVACALERYRLVAGQFPDTLAALTPRCLERVPLDVITGQPLHYRRTDDGLFVLYSVGWNETDDDGAIGLLPSGRGPEKKEGDWVWRYPAKP